MRCLLVVALLTISIAVINAAPWDSRGPGNGNGQLVEGGGAGNGPAVRTVDFEPLSRHRRSNRRRKPVSSSSSSSSSEEIRHHNRGGRGGSRQQQQAMAGRHTNQKRKLGGRQFYAAAPIAYAAPGYGPIMTPVMGAPVYG